MTSLDAARLARRRRSSTAWSSTTRERRASAPPVLGVTEATCAANVVEDDHETHGAQGRACRESLFKITST